MKLKSILETTIVFIFCFASLVIASKNIIPPPETFYRSPPLLCYDCKYFEEIIEDCNLTPVNPKEGFVTAIVFSVMLSDGSAGEWPIKDEHRNKQFSLMEMFRKIKNGECKVR